MAEGWVRTATLTGSSSDVRFGHAIDLDGHTAVIGADDAAYVYRKQGLRRIAALRASDASANDRFGASLAMERDVLVVRAPNLGGPSGGVVPGAAYVFARRGHQWIEQQKLVGSDALPGSRFGDSVAIENRAILVGAPYRNAPGEPCGTFSPEGNAYVFLPYRGTWFESQTLNGDARFCALFGNDVAMGRGLVAVTTPIFEAMLGTDGAALAFDWAGQELGSARQVTRTSGGDAITDLDFSGRTLIAGILNSVAFEGVVIGSVRILEFGRE
jgi:hypothetical protein